MQEPNRLGTSKDENMICQTFRFFNFLAWLQACSPRCFHVSCQNLFQVCYLENFKAKTEMDNDHRNCCPVANPSRFKSAFSSMLTMSGQVCEAIHTKRQDSQINESRQESRHLLVILVSRACLA